MEIYEGKSQVEDIVVAGHELSIREMQAFKAYSKEGSFAGVERVTGIHHNTVAKWSKTAWWQELYDTYIKNEMDDFFVQLVKNKGVVLDGYVEVMAGEDKSDRTANARIAGAKLFMEAGKNPILQKPGMQTNIIANTQVNLKLDDAKLVELARTDKAKLLEIAQTGIIPDDLVEI